ncbi:hypothetical protein NDU88_004623 [Pleurodeles waltl]|uniref:Uncharacterized protein n=1 Tax=Pleurodeles waltl TaxID=8319 RepID=A0AAV7LLW5_PLEWA|nr:hypothetical protein NDU88_004623 [Pleurodeles waltl]
MELAPSPRLSFWSPAPGFQVKGAITARPREESNPQTGLESSCCSLRPVFCLHGAVRAALSRHLLAASVEGC